MELPSYFYFVTLIRRPGARSSAPDTANGFASFTCSPPTKHASPQAASGGYDFVSHRALTIWAEATVAIMAGTITKVACTMGRRASG